MLPYNDKTTDDAHSNGLLMWETRTVGEQRTMANTGVWITSSCPGFGVRALGYGFNVNCMVHWQHAQCFTFDPKRVIADGAASYVNVPGDIPITLNPGAPRVNAPWTNTIGGIRTRLGAIEMIALHLIFRKISVQRWFE